MTLDLESLVYARRQDRHYGRNETRTTYLVGTIARCQCWTDAPVHLLAMSHDPDRLVPVCGSGDTNWCHDNGEGELDAVTCERCITRIKGATT